MRDGHAALQTWIRRRSHGRYDTDPRDALKGRLAEQTKICSVWVGDGLCISDDSDHH